MHSTFIADPPVLLAPGDFYLSRFFHCDFNPSMCSKRLDFTSDHMGSNIKSIPSLLANFAAGTKSLSQEIRIIWLTCFLYVREAISIPIRMSTPFC